MAAGESGAGSAATGRALARGDPSRRGLSRRGSRSPAGVATFLTRDGDAGRLPDSRARLASFPFRTRPMDRRSLTVAAAALVIGFLLGFVPEHIGRGHADQRLAEARLELRLSRDLGRLGAALAESMRGNYERARQLMAGTFSDLQATSVQVSDPRRRQALNGFLSQRDEIITLLSRAQPESSQRLMILYTQLFSALDPQGAVASAVTTAPAPPASAAPPPPVAPATQPAGGRR